MDRMELETYMAQAKAIDQVLLAREREQQAQRLSLHRADAEYWRQHQKRPEAVKDELPIRAGWFASPLRCHPGLGSIGISNTTSLKVL